MSPVTKFAIRAAAGLVGALFISKVFWKSFDPLWFILTAAFLVAMAYLAERMRRGRE